MERLGPARWVAATTAIVFAVGAISCEEAGGNLKYDNETTSVIYITTLKDSELQPGYALELPVGRRTTIGTLISNWPDTIEARDKSGRLLFSKKYTWNEIKSVNLTIVFICDAGVPAVTPVEVVQVSC